MIHFLITLAYILTQDFIRFNIFLFLKSLLSDS